MDREASFLRCSKLSCYAEFNRMVQTIARVGSTVGLRELQTANGRTGTGAEYHFYYTLTAMLREVVSNTNPVEQKRDLQRVYSWYSLNKPILKARTRRGQAKPLLSLSANDPQLNNRTSRELTRPQTAPASLCQELTLPVKNDPAFTSAYIRHSMMREIQSASPGQPFDELQTTNIQSQPPRIRPRSSESIIKRGRPKFSKESGKGGIPVVDLPTKEMFITHRRPATVPAVISCEQVFNLTSGVAANMVIDKEMKSMRDNFVRRAVSAQPVGRSLPRQPVNSPIDRPRATKQSSETSTLVTNIEDNSLLLQGKSVILSETDKAIAMETILEEQSLSALSSGASAAERHQPCTTPGAQSEGKKSNTKQEYSNDLSSNEQLIPLSAKVMLRNQSSQSEQQETIPTSGRAKRVAASVSVSTLTFSKDESRPRTQGRNPLGHLHKHRSRPNTVQSQTRYT